MFCVSCEFIPQRQQGLGSRGEARAESQVANELGAKEGPGRGVTLPRGRERQDGAKTWVGDRWEPSRAPRHMALWSQRNQSPSPIRFCGTSEPPPWRGVTVRWVPLPRAPFELLRGFYFYTEFSVPEWEAVISEWEREKEDCISMSRLGLDAGFLSERVQKNHTHCTFPKRFFGERCTYAG